MCIICEVVYTYIYTVVRRQSKLYLLKIRFQNFCRGCLLEVLNWMTVLSWCQEKIRRAYAACKRVICRSGGNTEMDQDQVYHVDLTVRRMCLRFVYLIFKTINLTSVICSLFITRYKCLYVGILGVARFIFNCLYYSSK